MAVMVYDPETNSAGSIVVYPEGSTISPEQMAEDSQLAADQAQDLLVEAQRERARRGIDVDPSYGTRGGEALRLAPASLRRQWAASPIPKSKGPGAYLGPDERVRPAPGFRKIRISYTHDPNRQGSRQLGPLARGVLTVGPGGRPTVLAVPGTLDAAVRLRMSTGTKPR